MSSRWFAWRAGVVVAICVAAACATPGGPSRPGPAAAGRGDPAQVTVIGSDSMLMLNRRLAVEFMRRHHPAVVRVEGGGTGRGVEALVSGRADLCAASRPLSSEEVQALYQARGTLGVQHLVALDAISVIVHPSTGIQKLTLAELSALYTGAIRNWRDLGGPDLPVFPVRRPASSGTHRFLRQHVFGGEFCTERAVMVATNAEMRRRVAELPGGIGYGRFEQSSGTRPVQIGGALPEPGVIRSGEYPLGRYLFYFTASPPEGPVERYVDWVLGPEGQQVVARSGFIPLWVQPDGPGPA